MSVKRVSDISFLTSEQSELFSNYTISNLGVIYNEKTGKETNKTIHGKRGYVVNLSISVGGKRTQRMIVVARAMADLFMRPIKDGEKICFIDNDNTNIDIDNIVYRMTKLSMNKEYCECSKAYKGITKKGRFCTICEKFVKWDDISSGSDGKKLSICKKCSSARGVKYQKSVGFSNAPAPFSTYHERLKLDNPIDVNGNLGIKCPECLNIFIPARSKVLGRVKLLSSGKTPVKFICNECASTKTIK